MNRRVSLRREGMRFTAEEIMRKRGCGCILLLGDFVGGRIFSHKRDVSAGSALR